MDRRVAKPGVSANECKTMRLISGGVTMNAVNDKPEITPDTNKQKLPPSGIDINLTNKSINQELLAARVAVANLLPHVDQAEKFLTIIVTNERHASKIRSSFWRSLFYPAHKIISEMDKKYAAYDELILFAVKAEIAAQLLGGITKKLTAQGYHLPGIAPRNKDLYNSAKFTGKITRLCGLT